MDSYLEQLQQVLKDTLACAESATSDNTPAGKWTCDQILEHLYLTYRGTNRGLDKCLEGGKPLATAAALKHRAATFLLVGLGYFPSGRKSPERAVPKGLPKDEVRASILGEIHKMDGSLAECEKKFGVRTKILDHPVLGPLNPGQWRQFHLVHARHHARQIRERVGSLR
jgi:hypothetical protein